MTSTRVLLRYAAAAVLLAAVVAPVTPASAVTGQPRLVAYDYVDPTTLEDFTATINVDNGQRAPLFDDIHSPAWSPDGSRLAFVMDDFIGIVNADGTTVTGADHPEAYTLTLTWSPYGNFIAYDVGPGDQIWITTTTEPFVTHRIPNVRGSSPSWSPDGTRIAYQQTSGNRTDKRRQGTRVSERGGPTPFVASLIGVASPLVDRAAEA